MIRLTKSILQRPIVYCHFKASTNPHRFFSIGTDIDESQKSIIDSLATDEVQRSQLVSLAKYLNLPWNNLVEFTTVVKAHEDGFKMRLEKEFNEANDEAITDYYLQNVFHIFSHSITESPKELLRQLDLEAIGSEAVELIRQKRWENFKNHNGRPISHYNSTIFLEELATRILNLEYLIPCVMPDGKEGHASKFGDSSLFIQSLPIEPMTFTSIPPEDCTDTKFELLYYHLNPTTVFAADSTTQAFSKDNFSTPKKEADIFDSSLSQILNYVIYRVFNESVLPNMNGGSGFEFKYEKQPMEYFHYNTSHVLTEGFNSNIEHNTSLSKQSPTGGDAYIDRRDASKEFLNLFQQLLVPIHGISDLVIRLGKKKHQITDETFESDHKLAIFELKYESNIGDLAMRYFPRDSKRVITLPFPSEKIKANYKDERKCKRAKNQAFHEKHDDLNKDEEKRFRKFLIQSISYCKLEGTTMNIISNGDDFILLFVDKFYEKIKNYDPKHDKIPDEWRLCIVKRNKFPILTVLSCVFLSEYKKFIDHRQLTNTEVVNWYQTYGSGKFKQIGDKTKFLINRKVFYKLMSKRIRFRDDTRELFNFKWKANEVSSLLKVKITQSIFNNFIKGAMEDIKSSYVWKQYTKHKKSHEFPLMKFDILNSEDFQIIEVLQNKKMGRHASVTTIRASLNHKQNGILKVYDTVRMLCHDKRPVRFRNGLTMNQSFRNLLVLSYKMFFTELLAFTILNGKDYIPKIYNSGVLYIPKLSALTRNEVDEIYENPFENPNSQEKYLKSDSLFIFTEYVEKSELHNIDYEKLIDEALEDLRDMHNAGVIHRDLSSRNILIRKSNETESGYKVIFIDFGLSLVSQLSKLKKHMKRSGGQTKFTDAQVKQISVGQLDEQLDELNDNLREIIFEKLKKIDREDLREAIRYYDPGK